MASFTDNQVLPYLTQYKDYVPQLPVQAMVEVGQTLQNRYDQGVQKIQNEIDNVAGIDVIKPLHKQYLQSKLNELGSRLKTVAAGDFSNFQLVNSVGGMIKQISKDPTIQNAAYSTQRIRQEQGNLETAKKAGKSSVQNEAFFNKQLNDWLADNDVKSTYNGQYVEYTDIDKKLRDIADKIKEVDNSVEIPYIRDNAGNTIYFDKNGNPTSQDKGQPMIDEATLSVKTKGKPAEKILANFYDSLNENDQRQLRIDSWYHYRGATPDSLKRDIVNNYVDKRKLLSDKASNLAIQVKNPNLSSTKKAQLQAQIVDTNDTLSGYSLDSLMKSDLEFLSNPNNLEEAKYRIYSQKYLTNLAKDLSYQSIEQSFKDNVYWQSNMKQKEFQLKVLEENNRNLRDNAHNMIELAKLDLDKQKFLHDKGLIDRPTRDVGLATTGEIPSLLSLDTDIKGLDEAKKELVGKYSSQIFPKLQGKEKIDAMNKFIDDNKTNPKPNLTSDERKFLQAYNNLDDDFTTQSNLRNALTDASNRFVESKQSEGLQKVGNLEVNGNSYSPIEIYNINNKLKSYLSLTPPSRYGTQDKVLWDYKAQQLLQEFQDLEEGKYLPIAQAFIKDHKVSSPSSPYAMALSAFGPKNNKDKEIVDKLGATDKIASNVESERQKFESDFLQKYSPKYQLQEAALNLDNKVDKTSLDNLLSRKFSEFSDKGALNTERFSQFDPSTINKWLESTKEGLSKKTKAILQKSNEPNKSRVVIFGPSGEEQIVPLNDKDIKDFFPYAAKSSPFNNIKAIINTSPGFTTNKDNIRVQGETDPSGAVNARINGTMLQGLKDTKYANLVRFTVQGDIDNTGNTDTDGYDLIMYVHNPLSGDWIPVQLNKEGYVTESAIIQGLNSIDASTIEQVLKTRK